MAKLRAAPPRPRVARVAPSYPRALATFAVILAGCGGVVENQASQPTDMPDPAGGIAAPFDADPPPDTTPPDAHEAGPADAAPEAETQPLPEPEPGGAMPAPFEDGGLEDTAAEVEVDK